MRAGFKRERRTRWLSSAFGVLVLVALGLGVLHSSGIWFGVGYWSALWTHQLVGFALIPLLLWHVASRPVRPKVTDIDRRSFLRTGVIAGGAAGLYVGQRAIAGVVGPAGVDRRHTGSYEVASFDPANLPRVSWINDSRPADTSADAWMLRVNGLVIPIATLWELARPVSAILDCTGGWWSEQRWDAVPLSMLLPEPTGRSVRVLSSTGYDRYFGHETLDDAVPGGRLRRRALAGGAWCAGAADRSGSTRSVVGEVGRRDQRRRPATVVATTAPARLTFGAAKMRRKCCSPTLPTHMDPDRTVWWSSTPAPPSAAPSAASPDSGDRSASANDEPRLHSGGSLDPTHLHRG